MKVIFLDIDGVLNSDEWHKSNKKKPISPYCVSFLNKIINATNAKIVISSAWRVSMQGTLSHLKKAGLAGEVIGSTPIFMMDEWRKDKSRGAEINQWLRDNASKIDNYVILDDRDDFTYDQSLHAVKTNYIIGLTENDADKAIEILNKNIKFEIDGKVNN